MTQVLTAPPRVPAGGPPPSAPEDASPGAPAGGPAEVLVRCRPSEERAAAAARALGLDPGPTAAVPDQSPSRRPGAKPHLRVVGPGELTPVQRRRRARAILVGSAMVALAIAFALVYFHVILAQRQFKVDDLNNRVQQQQLTYQKLRLQVAELGSPQNIISTAEGRLAMVQPASVTYLTPSTTIGSSGSSAGTGKASASSTSQGPAGDANWPAIKSQLAGSP